MEGKDEALKQIESLKKLLLHEESRLTLLYLNLKTKKLY